MSTHCNVYQNVTCMEVLVVVALNTERSINKKKSRMKEFVRPMNVLVVTYLDNNIIEQTLGKNNYL